MPATVPPLERLIGQAGALSARQRTLARFLVANYQQVAFATVRELAGMAGVSEATIVRFSKALGFGGYPAMQREVRRIVRADLTGVDRLRLADRGPGHDDSVLGSTARKELENIEALREGFQPDAFAAALAAIRRASNVLVVASRSTAPLAEHFGFGLDKLEIANRRFTTVDSATYDAIGRAGAGALVVVIGFPRYLREVVEAQSFARERGLPVLAITDSRFSPLRGDTTLFAPAESVSFVAFHAAPLILLNALLHGLSLAEAERTREALARFEAIARARDYFLPA